MSLPFHLISGITLSCALLLSSSTLWAQDYYKWVDANGSTHYTTTPPPKSAQKKGKIQTYGWNNSAPTTSRSNNPASTQANSPTTPTTLPATLNTSQAASEQNGKPEKMTTPSAPIISSPSGEKTPAKNY